MYLSINAFEASFFHPLYPEVSIIFSPKQQYIVARYFQILYWIYTCLYFLASTSEGSLFDNEWDKKYLGI